MAGKMFGLLVAAITIISAAFFAMHTWWLPPDISTLGHGVDHQLNETMIGTGLLFVAGQLVLALFVWMYGNKNDNRKIKFFPGGGAGMVTFACVIVGIEILVLTFVGSKVWASIYIDPAPADSMQIDVTAEQFAFYFRYPGPDGKFGVVHPELANDGNGNFFGLDPANDVAARDDIIAGTLMVPVNRPILLTMHSKDMIHSFYVPELRLQQDIVPGLTIPIHFTATKEGKYEIVCTQLCGLGHYSMRAFLQVVSQSDFDQWLKTQSGD
jgi:cytochrome c oxidase subunit II